MSVFEYVEAQFPEFRSFLSGEPEWYLSEMNYPVARRLLDFAVMLHETGRTADVRKLFDVVESGMSRDPQIADPLCIDFVQPIADLGPPVRSYFEGLLRPLSRSCYDAQVEP